MFVMKEEREPILPSKLTMDRIVLKCSDMGCRLGPGGARCQVTPSLPVAAAVELVLDHVEDYQRVDVDYLGVEDDWIMGCPEEDCSWDCAWEDDYLAMPIPEQELYNEYVQFDLVHLDIHRQLMHNKKERLIVMHCEACGWSTQGHKKGRLKKRLQSHLYECAAVVKPCEEEQHQSTFPTEPHKPKKEPENPVQDPVPVSIPVHELVPPHGNPVDGDVYEERLAVAVACKHYLDEGGDHADRSAHDEDNCELVDEVPHVGYEAHKVHHDDGEDNN
jgi:hypothetical protein